METYTSELRQVQEQVQEIEKGKRELRAQLHKFFLKEAAEHLPHRGPRVHRMEVPVPALDPLTWLQQGSSPVKTYWSDRQGSVRMAGAGVAHVISGHSPINFKGFFSELGKTLSMSHPHVRFYGGMRFDQSLIPNEQWTPFADYHFVVPRFELCATERAAVLACNVIRNPEKGNREQYEELEEEINRLRFLEDHDFSVLPRLRERHDIPDWEGWEEIVKSGLAMLNRGELWKIVLARKVILRLTHRIDPIALLQRLANQHSHAYHFCFQPSRDAAFLGISPELLYRRDKQEIYSEAIAGTRARGKDHDEDRTLAKELLNSDKDLREHRWVSAMVRRSLQPLCHTLDTTFQETLLPLPHVQHLYTRFQGRLIEGIGDADILVSLHPTPAVGGFPRDAAIRRIAGLEPFDRGWYAGPIGWVSRDASEFAVGIRSALISDANLSLFAGAGIVEGSDPRREWEENENKLLNFTGLFEGT